VNVLAVIIVGGLGSIPGVVIGSFILVGMPELLREFAEYRLLMYGILLIVMMLTRPEGFLPAEVIRRELHSDDEVAGQAQVPVAITAKVPEEAGI
jgi:branched-chain amino acid transport system permease protein